MDLEDFDPESIAKYLIGFLFGYVLATGMMVLFASFQ